MKLKLLIGVLLFLIVLNLATIGSFVYKQWTQEQTYQTHRLGHRAPVRIDGPRAMRALDPEKRQALRRLLDEFHEETGDLRDQIGRMETEAFALLERKTVPRDSLDMIMEQLSGLHLEISRRATDKLIEAKIHLDPRQQKMFFRMILTARPERGPGFFKSQEDAPRRGTGQRKRGNRI